MKHRLPHILCSLWLMATSLAPGHGWSLCFEASGRVVVEMTALAAEPGAGGAGVADCATDCPPDRCDDCRDVSLDVADRACPRRDGVASALAVAPACAECAWGAPGAAPRHTPRVVAVLASAPPPLRRVLRC